MVLDRDTFRRRLPQYYAAFAAALGPWTFGMALGWSSPATRALRGELGLALEEVSWVAGVTPLAAVPAMLVTALTVGRWGRRPVMLALGPPCAAGWALVAFGRAMPMLLAGRVITGFCGGAFCGAVPIYTGEIAEKQIRGALGVFFQLLLTCAAEQADAGLMAGVCGRRHPVRVRGGEAGVAADAGAGVRRGAGGLHGAVLLRAGDAALPAGPRPPPGRHRRAAMAARAGSRHLGGPRRDGRGDRVVAAAAGRRLVAGALSRRRQGPGDGRRPHGVRAAVRRQRARLLLRQRLRQRRHRPRRQHLLHHTRQRPGAVDAGVGAGGGPRGPPAAAAGVAPGHGGQHGRPGRLLPRARLPRRRGPGLAARHLHLRLPLLLLHRLRPAALGHPRRGLPRRGEARRHRHRRRHQPHPRLRRRQVVRQPGRGVRRGRHLLDLRRHLLRRRRLDLLLRHRDQGQDPGADPARAVRPPRAGRPKRRHRRRIPPQITLPSSSACLKLLCAYSQSGLNLTTLSIR